MLTHPLGSGDGARKPLAAIPWRVVQHFYLDLQDCRLERIVAFVWALAGLGSYSVSTPRSSSMVSTGPSAGSSSSGGRESQVWPSVPQRRSARSSSLSASLMEVRERRASAGTAAPSEMINVYYMYRMEAREHELLRAQAATHHVQGVRRVKHVPAMLSKGGHCTRERRALVQCGQMLRRVRATTHAHTLGFF